MNACTPGHEPEPVWGGVTLLVADLVDGVVDGAADLVADLAELLAEGELAPVLVPLIVPLPPALARVIPVPRWRGREEREGGRRNVRTLHLGDFADAFIQGYHSCTHSHTDSRVNHSGRQPARQEPSKLRRLAWIKLATVRLQVKRKKG